MTVVHVSLIAAASVLSVLQGYSASHLSPSSIQGPPSHRQSNPFDTWTEYGRIDTSGHHSDRPLAEGRLQPPLIMEILDLKSQDFGSIATTSLWTNSGARNQQSGAEIKGPALHIYEDPEENKAGSMPIILIGSETPEDDEPPDTGGPQPSVQHWSVFQTPSSSQLRSQAPIQGQPTTPIDLVADIAKKNVPGALAQGGARPGEDFQLEMSNHSVSLMDQLRAEIRQRLSSATN